MEDDGENPLSKNRSYRTVRCQIIDPKNRETLKHKLDTS